MDTDGDRLPAALSRAGDLCVDKDHKNSGLKYNIEVFGEGVKIL